MPAHYGFGTDEEGTPNRTRQLPREGGEEEAIAGLPARRTGSAPKHVQLMAEHQQLDVAIAVPAGEQGVEKQAEDGVDDR